MKSVIDIDVLGSYNTVKATLPYLLESAAKHRTDGKTRKYRRVRNWPRTTLACCKACIFRPVQRPRPIVKTRD